MEKSNQYIFLAVIAGLLCSCSRPVEEQKEVKQSVPMAIESAILQETDNFYYINFKDYPEMDKTLPIGVFDSGTGGLTVLDALVQFDEYQNSGHQKGSDGKPDFLGEKFIYLADQANMPYGNYSSEDKTALLVEHIIKDTQFMLSNKFYKDKSARQFSTEKSPIKTLVIACNTATAYGKELIDEFIEKAGIELHVIGVIDAGARGALQEFEIDESGAVGVMATVGTVASKGYEKTILRIKEDLDYTGEIQVYNQGGHGIAEVVDGEPDFIDREAASPREGYRGPSLESTEFPIDKTLMDIYNFDFDHDKMLCDSKNTDDCQVLQINDAENYVRYHLVSLMEKIRTSPNALPLKAIVLGCTHYPYLTSDIKKVLDELYNYRNKGVYIYRDFMKEEIAIIDPSVNVAKELYAYLSEKQLFNPNGNMKDSEFYISVPNKDNKDVKMDESGRFPYAYKYGRKAGEIQEYVKVVPFSKDNIPSETVERLSATIPLTFSLIPAFSKSSKLIGHEAQ
ncbi:aspartate/glutamate racemase family protein [Echinicola sp. CAU 1574]|uniref:Aspartate/glutamate racemase family protein n=1 Tax=Echinicola arenosa TaxID=2774144 RepID=A0ABR9AHG5_9BACT|nr:aspartate/glutamate racemase family protein [Echinicola arenosa]MBD8487278.1 aspartate/glutamate racemase family protein [Echinicola arenosa]